MMEFGVALAVGGGPSSARRADGYDEACKFLLGRAGSVAGAPLEGSPAEPPSAHTEGVRAPSHEDTAGTPLAAISDGASAFYDNEVQNEKEQEVQVEVEDEVEDESRAYPGMARPEESWPVAELVVHGGATPPRAIDGALRPWYGLEEFELAGLPCALAPRTAPQIVALCLSTNHTARRQALARDGTPIPRRLRNIVMLLHYLPPPRGEGGEASPEGSGSEWLMAVSLAEAQSLLLLLRRREGPAAPLSGQPLALIRADDGALLAATQLYRNRRTALGSGSVDGARQLMRFVDNARRFSRAEVGALAPYLQDISPKLRLRYYCALLRGRRRDRSDGDGEALAAVFSGQPLEGCQHEPSAVHGRIVRAAHTSGCGRMRASDNDGERTASSTSGVPFARPFARSLRLLDAIIDDVSSGL